MGIKLVVAVTDRNWFDALRACQPPPREVNFWSPSSGRTFRALQPGELFLFKLHAPDNKIAGGGVFAHTSVLPCSFAWEAFGETNGALTERGLRKSITQYRGASEHDRSDFSIGCRILTQPFFLEESDWIPVPKNWSSNIVSFKTYDTDDSEGRALWDSVREHLLISPEQLQEGHHFGAPQIIQPRLGQGAFRALVTDVYDRRCAVTRERTLPALEAAHIYPYKDGGMHEARNGLLLRRDIHSLFDAGYVTVTPDLAFEVSRHIREQFENGRDYYALHGTRIQTPDDIGKQPDRDALIWHNENCYKS